MYHSRRHAVPQVLKAFLISIHGFSKFTWYLMRSEPHHSRCLWRWRQPQACEQCPQWSCPPGSSLCLLCWCIHLNCKMLPLLHFLFECVSETCNNDNCAGSGNIHSIASRNKLDTFLWLSISQSHPDLFDVKCHQIQGDLLFYEIKPVAREEEPHNHSWV